MENKLMFIFRQNPPKKKNRGRVTIVGKFSDGILYLSASKNHSKLDRFDKQEGRWRALERLIKGEFLEMVVVAEFTAKEFLKHAVPLANKVSNGSLKPVNSEGLIRPFKIKDFLDSPILPQDKKEAYLRHNDPNYEAPATANSPASSIH